MRRLSRLVGLTLLWLCAYLLGLAFVAYMTVNVYVDVNLAGTTAWEECDDCGLFMSNDAWYWTTVMAALYTAACLGFGAYLVSRRWRRGGSAQLHTRPDEASQVRD